MSRDRLVVLVRVRFPLIASGSRLTPPGNVVFPGMGNVKNEDLMMNEVKFLLKYGFKLAEPEEMKKIDFFDTPKLRK